MLEGKIADTYRWHYLFVKESAPSSGWTACQTWLGPRDADHSHHPILSRSQGANGSTEATGSRALEPDLTHVRREDFPELTENQRDIHSFTAIGAKQR